MINTYHQSTETLLYNNFIKLELDASRLDLLIISGHPSQEELEKAWNDIQQEYSDGVKCEKSSSLLQCAKRCLRNEWMIEMVDLCLWILRKGWNSDAAQQLADIGYDYVHNMQTEDNEAYQAWLNRIEMEANFLKVLQGQLENEYKLLASGNGESSTKARTMQDYNNEIAIVAKCIGFGIDKCAISTAMWVGYLNVFFEHIEDLKRQAYGRAV